MGLQLDFAKDLPPDPVSEDGFQNSSEMLQMSVSQYGTYLELNRDALNRATVRGERPEVLYWGISAERAATRRTKTVKELDAEIEENAKKNGVRQVKSKRKSGKSQQCKQRRHQRRQRRSIEVVEAVEVVEVLTT